MKTRLAFQLLALVALASGSPRQLSHSHLLHKNSEPQNAATKKDGLNFFKMLVNLAEDIHTGTGNLEAAVAQLRTAFLLCPRCRYDEFAGDKFREAFSIDGLGDRLYLTQEIFPAILKEQGPEGRLKLLWAGSHPYTLRYEYLLKGVEMTSADPNPGVAVYGSSHRHLVDVLQNIGESTKPGTFDVAIANGVVGWGIDTDAQVADFVNAMHAALKPGGILIVGFNRHMVQCCSFETLFELTSFQGLPSRKDFEGQWQHTFEIYRRI